MTPLPVRSKKSSPDAFSPFRQLFYPSITVKIMIILSQVKLSPMEQRVYDMVSQGDVMCKQFSPSESGAIPGLVQKGLIEIYKKNMSLYHVKKNKFARKL